MSEREEWREEILMLYGTVTRDIAFFKQQQWAVTNYVLLLHGAIIGLAQLLNEKLSSSERVGLCVVGTLVGSAALYLLWSLERSVKAGRQRLEHVRATLSVKFRSAFESDHKVKQGPMVAVLLAIAVLVGVLTVWWAVYWKGLE